MDGMGGMGGMGWAGRREYTIGIHQVHGKGIR
jgi:hypothetical protein